MCKVIAVVLGFLLAAYPMTSMHGTCARFPLEDFFFDIYWPLTNWIWHQGLSFGFAVIFSVLIPNLLALFLAFNVFRKLVLRVNEY